MQTYDERKAAKTERLEKRLAKKQQEAAENDLSLYGEEKSGIPMGQPIIVGHHSEGRHRKHLARIEKKVRKGFEAANEAKNLSRKIKAIETNRAIMSDDPEAVEKIDAAILRKEQERDRSKQLNQLARMTDSVTVLANAIRSTFPEHIVDAETVARNLKEKPIPEWYFTNLGAEIRRMKKRRESLAEIGAAHWEPIETEAGRAYLKEGRVCIQFNWRIAKEESTQLKRSPLAFHWSPTNSVWMRKHTATTQSRYFRSELVKFLCSIKKGESDVVSK